MKRRILACILVILCLLTGCSSDPEGRAVTHKDLILILPADFLELAGEGTEDFLYGRHSLVFKGLSESKAGMQDLTLAGYTDRVIQANEKTATAQASGAGYLFTYEAPVGDTVYAYTVATFEGRENFWILQFYCPKDKLEENQPEINVILEGIQPI